jgi:hypothetical protein
MTTIAIPNHLPLIVQPTVGMVHGWVVPKSINGWLLLLAPTRRIFPSNIQLALMNHTMCILPCCNTDFPDHNIDPQCTLISLPRSTTATTSIPWNDDWSTEAMLFRMYHTMDARLAFPQQQRPQPFWISPHKQLVASFPFLPLWKKNLEMEVQTMARLQQQRNDLIITTNQTIAQKIQSLQPTTPLTFTRTTTTNIIFSNPVAVFCTLSSPNNTNHRKSIQKLLRSLGKQPVVSNGTMTSLGSFFRVKK